MFTVMCRFRNTHSDLQGQHRASLELWYSCFVSCSLVRGDCTIEKGWTKFLSRTQNAIKLFVILEALIDIGFGTLILVEPNVTDVETDIANAAIGFASLAIVLTLVSICAFETVYKADISKKGFFFTTIVDSLFTVGIVLNDISDIFLLSRAVITNTFEEKEMAVFGFMMANAFITEGTVLATYIADKSAAKKAKHLRTSERLSGEDRRQLENSIKMFRAARKKARFQASITGLLAIPLVLACASFREILSFGEQIQLALMSLSAVPALVAALVTDEFFALIIPGTYLQAQEYGPKLLNLAWTAIYLLIEDSFPSLGVGRKNVTFGLYFAYVAIPAVVRVLVDSYRYYDIRKRVSLETSYFGRRPWSNYDFLLIGLAVSSCEKVHPIE